MPMQDPIIDVKNLSLAYVERNFRLEVDDLQVKPGELTAIIGGSGSGKSTLMDVLGIIKPPKTKPNIRYSLVGIPEFQLSDLWKQPRELSKLKRSLFGYMFQQSFFIPEIVVRKNVEASLILSESNEPSNDKILTFLRSDLFRKDENITGNELSGELSGGQKHRLALVRALVHDPQLLFLDEPTGDLDINSSKSVFGYLKNSFLQNNSDSKAVIMVTHAVDLAIDFADTIYFIDRGKKQIGKESRLCKKERNWYFKDEKLSRTETLDLLMKVV